MLASEVQPSNALHPIPVTEFPIVTFLSAIQPLKACDPIFKTEFGISILSIDAHPENAS